MKDKLLIDKINQGENSQFELKATFSPKGVLTTICSFLNTNGGTLLIGVNDFGEIIGLSNTGKIKNEIEHLLYSEIVPEPAFDVSIEKITEKQIIIIKVWEGSKQPYIYNGDIYFRKESLSRKVTTSELSLLIKERQISELHWEKQITFNLRFDDLDQELISNTIIDIKKT